MWSWAWLELTKGDFGLVGEEEMSSSRSSLQVTWGSPCLIANWFISSRKEKMQSEGAHSIHLSEHERCSAALLKMLYSLHMRTDLCTGAGESSLLQSHCKWDVLLWLLVPPPSDSLRRKWPLCPCQRNHGACLAGSKVHLKWVQCHMTGILRACCLGRNSRCQY